MGATGENKRSNILCLFYWNDCRKILTVITSNDSIQFRLLPVWLQYFFSLTLDSRYRIRLC